MHRESNIKLPKQDGFQWKEGRSYELMQSCHIAGHPKYLKRLRSTEPGLPTFYQKSFQILLRLVALLVNSGKAFCFNW